MSRTEQVIAAAAFPRATNTCCQDPRTSSRGVMTETQDPLKHDPDLIDNALPLIDHWFEKGN